MQNFVLMESFISKSLAWLWEIVLSLVCSNLYMEFFVRNLLATILPNHVKWFRYVDNVLCLWPKSMNLQSFLYDLNNLVPSIKFSVEVEQQNCLPFLDVLIIRK